MTAIITILCVIIVFGLIIFIHELGHFLTAKMFGVKVHEFALGMGPAILKKKIGETQYALRLFPIGGFVSMEGEDSESDDDRAFNKKKPYQRFHPFNIWNLCYKIKYQLTTSKTSNLNL